MSRVHPFRRGAPARALPLPVTLASAALLAVACGPSSSDSTAPGGDFVDPSANPGKVIQDPNEDGQGSSLKIAEVRWGRLVNVYDAADEDGDPATPPVRALQFAEFIISENIITDGANYILETNPFTEQTELTILADADSDELAPGTSGETQRERFQRLLDNTTENLGFVSPTGLDPSFLPPFPLVPRNATVSVRFSDLLDPGTISEQTVRVFSGNPPTKPVGARIVADPNYGGLIQTGGGVVKRTTRILIDFTISEAEKTQTSAEVNSVGLEPSVSNNLVNVALRFPSELDPAVGQFQVLRNLRGKALDTQNNGPVDMTGTKDVVRAFRSGRSDEELTNNDPNNGFLLDIDPPQIIGTQPVSLTTTPVLEAPGGDTYVTSFQFSTAACAQTPREGDILRLNGVSFTEVFAEVIQLAAPPSGGLASDVRVRLLRVPAAANFDLIRSDFEVASSGDFQSTFRPGSGVVPECFFSISPVPVAPPTGFVSTQPQIALRFSEPMDPTSITPFDSFRLDRVMTSANPTPLDTVIGEVNFSPDLRQFRYSPLTNLDHVNGQSESVFLNVAGLTDLAGNGLVNTLPADIELTVDPNQPTTRAGGFVFTFDEIDEDANGTTIDPTMPIPEIRGQFLYDTAAGLIRPREVSRDSRPADRTRPLLQIMTQTAGPIITPLSPLGSRMMTVWRYTEVGYEILDESTSNIDVEGINWAPFGGSVSTDFFESFEMNVAHSRHLPDEFPIDITQGGGGYAMYPTSGLNKSFVGNALNKALVNVYPRDRGYLLTPNLVFTSPVNSSLRLMPFPWNRQDTALEDFTFYTWRDTAILETGGSNGFGADVRALSLVGALPCNDSPFATTYDVNEVRTLALPFLMEFKCFPDDGAVGLNGLDTSFALATERRPIFRVFSTGGFKKSGAAFVKDPDDQPSATGGFNGQTGQGTPGDDNTVMVGQLDVVVRVSRVYTIWLESGTNVVGLPNYLEPIIEPRPDAQPSGTNIVLAFRGASMIAIPEPNEPTDEYLDARKYDAYGDPAATRVITGPNCPGNAMAMQNDLDETFSNFEPVFFPDSTSDEWTADINTLDGSEFIQARITFISNAATGLRPELSTLAIPFTR